MKQATAAINNFFYTRHVALVRRKAILQNLNETRLIVKFPFFL
jgi:hypothetical protein